MPVNSFQLVSSNRTISPSLITSSFRGFETLFWPRYSETKALPQFLPYPVTDKQICSSFSVRSIRSKSWNPFSFISCRNIGGCRATRSSELLTNESMAKIDHTFSVAYYSIKVLHKLSKLFLGLF
ncbi:hypothetical protein TNCV_298871 [Trichonephila clavipes]|nr:hypothetical protein TNCV_298871 [Trichonephila clavipes]